MNVYDTANKLAEEIKNSDEFKNIEKYKKELKSNEEVNKKVNEFEQKRKELQMITLNGGEWPKDKAKEIQELYAEIIKDDLANNYLEAETKFGVLIGDVNKIIGDAIKDVL